MKLSFVDRFFTRSFLLRPTFHVLLCKECLNHSEAWYFSHCRMRNMAYNRSAADNRSGIPSALRVTVFIQVGQAGRPTTNSWMSTRPRFPLNIAVRQRERERGLR